MAIGTTGTLDPVTGERTEQAVLNIRPLTRNRS